MIKIYNVDIKENNLSSFFIIGLGIYFFLIDTPNFISVLLIGFGLFFYFYHKREKKNKKVIFELRENEIFLSENNLKIDKQDFNKLEILINKKVERLNDFDTYKVIVTYDTEKFQYNIDNSNIQQLIDCLTNFGNSIKILDKRENDFKTQRLKNLKDEFQINIFGVFCFGFLLLLSLTKYDSLLIHNPLSTNGKVAIRLLRYIDSIGGKYLLIGIFGFFLILFIIKLIESKQKIK